MRGEYAKRTTMSPAQSRVEIERTLKRYGATGFAYAYSDGCAQLAFKIDGTTVRFTIREPSGHECNYTPKGRTRTSEQARAAREQLYRQRWRALSLAVKAWLEFVDSGATTMLEEFASSVVLPGGETVGEHAARQLHGRDLDVPLLTGPATS